MRHFHLDWPAKKKRKKKKLPVTVEKKNSFLREKESWPKKKGKRKFFTKKKGGKESFDQKKHGEKKVTRNVF